MRIAAVAADKKKGAELTLADAKKQVRDLLLKIQPVDDIGARSLSGGKNLQGNLYEDDRFG
jgi:hypothetical protein